MSLPIAEPRRPSLTVEQARGALLRIPVGVSAKVENASHRTYTASRCGEGDPR
jgi:hypothetical protein